MKYLLIFTLLLFGPYKSVSQVLRYNPWKRLILNEESYDKKGPYFLVQVNSYERLFADDPGVSIAKRLDGEFLILRSENHQILSNVKSAEGQWFVNDDWKLYNVNDATQSTSTFSFLVKTTCSQGLDGNIPGLSVRKLKYSTNLYEVKGSFREVKDRLLANDCVIAIGRESLNPVQEANVRDLNFTFNGISSIHRNDPQVNGRGITVSIKDNQYRQDDLDLLGKDIPSGINSQISDDHSTQMGTIIGGRGNTFITGRGVAREASLSSSDFSDIVPDTDEEYSSLGINLQNHSYGTVIESFYGTLAEAYDRSSYDNPNILHVFSAGNQGFATSSGGRYAGIPGVANLTGNFKMSKNTLSVGSTDADGNVISFSSRGPAYDGRVKPELVTYSFVGTSNSAAMVTGLSALLEQVYFEDHSELPSSALLKSLLITGAEDVGREGIDFETGYGSVQGQRTLENLSEGQFFVGEVEDQGRVVHTIQVPDNAVNLKVSLVWTDLPSTPTVDAIALVNDLDLKVLRGETTWLPWVLSSNPTEFMDLPIRDEDHLNTVEVITIDAPEVGAYEIEISGFEVLSGGQSYAVSFDWDLADRFEWTYPSIGDNLPYDGEAVPYLQWQNSYSAGTSGHLEFTLDGGNTWTTISSSVDLSQGFFRWDNYPDGITLSQLRMTINESMFESDTFVISTPLNVNVGFDCGDSLLFVWEQVPDIISYNVYSLVGNDLQLLTNTSDTTMLIEKDLFPSNFIAIEPLLEDGQPGIRSFALNFDQEGFPCYINSFFPVALPEEERIELITEIGSTFNVEVVNFERSTGGSDFEQIGSIAPTQLEFAFDDFDPGQGINIYRAVVQLTDGTRITSEPSDIYFLTTQPFLLFPNPVDRPDAISVFTKEFGDTPVTVEVFNLQGELILTKELISDRDRITTSQLTEGLYFYRIRGGEYSATGRIVVR